jgi:hypothetical protein
MCFIISKGVVAEWMCRMTRVFLGPSDMRTTRKLKGKSTSPILCLVNRLPLQDDCPETVNNCLEDYSEEIKIQIGTMPHQPTSHN